MPFNTSLSVVPFSSCLQCFPASGCFLMIQFFTSGGQSIGVSASASVLPMNTQDWSSLERTVWISLQSKGLSKVFSSTTVQKHQFFSAQLSSQSNSHIHTWLLEKQGSVNTLVTQMFNETVSVWLTRTAELFPLWPLTMQELQPVGNQDSWILPLSLRKNTTEGPALEKDD